MKLDDDEREVAARELEVVLGQLPAGAAQQHYRSLLEQVASGEVSAESEEALCRLLEVGLESGRIRAEHGAHAEMAANRLFSRSPRGKELRSTLGAVNQALVGLAGQEIRKLVFEMRAPGSYSLSLETSAGRTLIAIDRRAVRVQSVEIGG